MICIYCRRKNQRIRRDAIQKKKDADLKYEETYSGIVLGFYYPKYIPPLKIAGTDRESRKKLKQMIKLVDHSHHEWKIYKDIHKPIDANKLKLAGPKWRRKQKFNIFDFRTEINTNYTITESEYSFESSVTNKEDNVEDMPIGQHCEIKISNLEDNSAKSPKQIDIHLSDSSSDYSKEYSGTLNSEECEIETPDVLLRSKPTSRGMTATKEMFIGGDEEL